MYARRNYCKIFATWSIFPGRNCEKLQIFIEGMFISGCLSRQQAWVPPFFYSFGFCSYTSMIWKIQKKYNMCEFFFLGQIVKKLHAF